MVGNREEFQKLKALEDWALLSGADTPGSEIISISGYRLLEAATQTLLRSLRLDDRFPLSMATQIAISLFVNHAREMRFGPGFRGRSVEHALGARLSALESDDGAYVFPARFGPRAEASHFTAGPVTILSRKNFDATYANSIADSRSDAAFNAAVDWDTYIAPYDHFVVVEMKTFHQEMAWPLAREIADYFLNLVRLLFGYKNTRSVKLSGGHMQETRRSTMRFDRFGAARPTWHRGPWGGLLSDGWADRFENELAPFKTMLGSFALNLATGDDLASPAIERLRYAHRLIAEAYSEPHEPQRLVRFVSALETLSLVPGNDKAHMIAKHCSCAGGWGDAAFAADIYDSVRNAYHWRSRVVHGDTPNDYDIHLAFSRIEQYALPTIIGFMLLYTAIYQIKPQSVGALRRAFFDRIDHFFWDTDAALLRTH